MPRVVQLAAPRQVSLVPEPAQDVGPGQVRVRTLHSGVSAGTELTAYRGTNPLVSRQWDPQLRLFAPPAEGWGPGYPLTGWGYSEVGRVVEAGPDVTRPAVGDVVWGVWGHRSEAVLPAAALARHVLAPELDPLVGVFARVGGIALNAVLAADLHLGEQVAVAGQGVIGLLATRMAVLNGARVAALDLVAHRRAAARDAGAEVVLDPAACGPLGAAGALREWTQGRGVDVSLELSGSYAALHEAVRSVAVGGTVVAAGFYQGEGTGLRLGEEFHHNRVRLVSSQIGGVPAHLSPRWDPERLQRTVMWLVARSAVDPLPLVTHRVPAAQVADAFDLLDRGGEALQVVLDFEDAP